MSNLTLFVMSFVYSSSTPGTLITVAETKQALKKLKNNKAAGICSITAELHKSGGDSLAEWMTIIMNAVWVNKSLPHDWKRGIILPFWKNKGDKLVCSNHRGITLLSIPGKLNTRILLTRALPAIRSQRRIQQAGFIPNRSTTDHISATRFLIENPMNFAINDISILRISTSRLPSTPSTTTPSGTS